MGVKRFVSFDMTELDTHVGLDVYEWLRLPVELVVDVSCRIEYTPDIVGISMRVKSDLLF